MTSLDFICSLPHLLHSDVTKKICVALFVEQNTIVDDVATSAGVTNISAFITWPSPPNDRFLNQFVVVVDISPILISQRKKRQTMPSREIPVNRSQVSITIPDLPPHSNIAASVNAEYLVGNDRTRALLVRPASFETLQGGEYYYIGSYQSHDPLCMVPFHTNVLFHTRDNAQIVIVDCMCVQ